MDGMKPRLKDKLTVGASSQWAAWFASLAPAAFVEKSNWVISCFELPPGWRYFSCGKYGKMLIIWWLFNFNRAWWLSKSGWNGLSANVQTNLRICGVFKTSRYMFPPFKDSSANQNPGTSSKQNIGSWPINIFHGHLTSRWLHQRQYNIPNQIQPYWQGAKEGLLTIQLDRLGVLLSRGFPISFKKRPFLLFWIQTSWAKSLQTLPIVRILNW